MGFEVERQVGVKTGLEVKGSYKEKEVVKKLSNYFFVTFSKEGMFKTTEYVFAFLKPDETFKVSFNLQTEVLLLFSRYPNFDTRVMDLVDKTLFEFENRLDRVCVIIVSNDNRIDSKIAKLNNDNKDSKIIIPFTYDQITSSDFDETSLKNKFRKYFYNRDLFALESPLKSETYFFGRNHIVQSMYDKYTLGEHGGLFGLRKIGKTSVLFAVERLVKVKDGVSIYVDCQDTNIHKARWFEVLSIIIKLIKEKYGLSNLPFSKPDSYNEKKASSIFEYDLRLIRKHLNQKRIMIIFDEIEHLTFNTSSSEHWQDGSDYLSFWQTLRAIYQKNSDLFSFVIAGVNPMCIEQPLVNEFDNPIFGIIKPIYLDLFSIKDVTEMVGSIGNYMGLNFAPEIFSDLVDDYGGHPFLIRHIASLINQDVKLERPYFVDKYQYRGKKEIYDRNIQAYIELILAVLKKWYPEEYSLLEELIEDPNLFKEYVYKFGGVIEHLLGYGIVKEVNGKYYMSIKAVEHYIQSRKKLKGYLKTKEGRQEEITKRRNSIEDRLRQIILTILKANYGKRAKDEVLKLIELSRQTKLAECDINNIFSDKLLFSDLMRIVLKNWTLFEKIFIDKTKFEIYMDYINKHRIDAHGKDISEEDFGILLIGFNWIEEILEQFRV